MNPKDKLASIKSEELARKEHFGDNYSDAGTLWLISRIETLEAALEFYADCDLVTGRLARKALEDGE